MKQLRQQFLQYTRSIMALMAVTGLGFFSTLPASAFSGGVVGNVAAGCSCHGGQNNAVSILLESQDNSFTLKAGETKTFTLVVAHAPASGAGMNLRIVTGSGDNAGMLSVAQGSGARVNSGELTHQGTRSFMSGEARFTFSWTAPTEPGQYTVGAVGNAVNGNGQTSGDAWNFMQPVTINVEAASSNTERQQDSIALIALYDALNGEQWTEQNWKSGESMDIWVGVTLANDRVTELRLANNNLDGEIPDALYNLSELERLDLARNSIAGEVSEGIGSLAKLKFLSLTGNSLNGTLPEDIGNLVNLEALYLNLNSFTGAVPTSLGSLTKLTEVEMNGNQFSGSIPASLGNWKVVTYVGLHNNAFEGELPNGLSGMTAVQILNLADNNLSGAVPADFANFADIRRLLLQNNDLSDLPDVSALTTMEELDVSGNALTFEDLEPNAMINGIVYAAQDSIGEEEEYILGVGTDIAIMLSVDVPGENNIYRWYKNGEVFPLGTENSISVSPEAPADTTIYRCSITNSVVPGLVIESRQFVVIDTNIVSVEEYREFAADIELVHSPNPVSEQAALSFTLAQPSQVMVTVFDMQGKVVLTTDNVIYGNGRNTITLPTASLLEGRYWYSVNVAGSVATGSMVVKR